MEEGEYRENILNSVVFALAAAFFGYLLFFRTETSIPDPGPTAGVLFGLFLMAALLNAKWAIKIKRSEAD